MGHIYGDYAVFEHKIGFPMDERCGIIVCGDRMDTRLFTVNPEKPDKAVLEEAGKIIKKGGLVAFPTETVYGLGGDALNRESSKKIYAAKGRPSDNPLIVHISNNEMLYKYYYNRFQRFFKGVFQKFFSPLYVSMKIW